MNKQLTRTEDNSQESVEEQLIGCWSCFLCHGQKFDDGVMTQEFTSDGVLISTIRDGEEVTVFRHRYRVSGDKIIITDPPIPSMAGLVREKFRFDEAGNLIIESNGVKSWFRRV